MKKIISFVLCALILLQCTPSLAKQTSGGSEKAILEKLEIMPSGKKADDTVSRLEFAM